MQSILLVLGSVIGSLMSIKYLFVNSLRIPKSVGKLFLKHVQDESTFKFLINEELTFDKKQQNNYHALVKFRGIYMLVYRYERLFTAGWQSKEILTDIVFWRWNTAKIKAILVDINNDEKTNNIYAMSPWGNSLIGNISVKDYSIVLDKELYVDIENDVRRVMAKEIPKTSALLYGPPGNGKSRFVRYISQKYELPIYTLYFSPDYTNLDILEAFSMLPSRAIVLFEDFDNYFDDRKCILPSENIKFSYDILLNCLDGVYNDYKETIFFMTVNDITKVSDALKNRPSRFKYVREFGNPSRELRCELLGSIEYADEVGDVNLDEIFKLRDAFSNEKRISI